ncbi:vWA domain-containing protein [Kribbella sindirgiensis]|uniref:VWA domain-containing protein n=1 Tax=Kribbella sindirgiensis TaxID=1124744 RepID=A0A4R0J167_9ACTN|nr:VWA domain-containing protein [Kribbella sindirgiensis]TCC34875.1 VWA domain-containing protein [Kribbella sindirgiensis]
MIRRAALLAVVGLAIALTSANAAATPAADPYSPVMVVLDSSGSMKARDAGGPGTRMDAAKRAVSSMVDGLPAQARVGLTVYGAGTGSAGSEKAAGCRDVQVVQPVGAVNKPALKAAVNRAQARGYTPIGQSLRTAAAQLPAEGQRSIVLVSDGEDTCAPPQPCEVAKELHRQGIDLHVHTIGFRVGAAARAQLACIAQTTGGTYHDADDAGTLTGVLGRVTEKALRHYEPIGKPVTGTNDPTTAPLVAPGQYVDTLNSQEERFYTVDLKDGETLYFAGTAIFPRGNVRDVEALDIRITGPGGADCNKRERQLHTRAKADGGSLSTVLRWDELADGTSQSRTCDEAGRYTLRLTRDNKGTDRVPVELLVRVEPPVTGGKGDPEQAARVEFAGQPAGAGLAVRGGGSFNEATTLAGPGRYAETVYYGEQLFYRVKLDWGQGLAYRITYGGVPDGKTVNVATSLFNPVRDEIDSDTTAYTGNTMTLPYNGKPIATTRVMYLNREGGAADIRKMAVDGWYYIMVKLGAADGAGGVPVKIDLAVAGTKVNGPEYNTVDSTPEATPSETPTSSPSSTPENGSGTASGPIDGRATSDDSGSALPWVIGGAAGLLAVTGVAIALILRNRRPLN